MNQKVIKFFFDVLPIAVFYLINLRGNWIIEHISLFSSFEKPIYPATAVFMILTIITSILSWIFFRSIPILSLISCFLIIIFGSLTLWFQNDSFIKMKFTIISFIFSTILFTSLVFKKNFIEKFLDTSLRLDKNEWRKLTLRWAFFFLFLSILNEIIWRNFSDQFWINFKVFGVTLITIIFTITQIPLIKKFNKNIKKK